MVKIMENPIKIHDLGVALFLETPICFICLNTRMDVQILTKKSAKLASTDHVNWWGQLEPTNSKGIHFQKKIGVSHDKLWP